MIKLSRRFFIPAIIICGMAFFNSCSYFKKHTPNALYFQGIMDSVTQKFDYSQKSLRFLDSLFALYPNADPAARAHFYAYYSEYYSHHDDYKLAMLYADSMLMLVHNNPGMDNYDREDAVANIAKGDILFATKEYNGAYQYFYLGKLAAQKSLDACTYSEYSYRLGMVLYKRTNYAEAAIYFRKAFEESNVCPDAFNNFFRRQELLSNTALSYHKKGQLDSALVYYLKALNFIATNEIKYQDKKSHIQVARAVVYGNLAKVYAGTDFDKAEALYKKSIAINSIPGRNIGDALITQVHLAELYYDRHSMQKVFNTLQNIKKGVDTIHYDHANTEWARLMWLYYDENKNTALAYKWLQQYNKFRDTEAENNKKLDATDVTGQMKNLEDEYQINLLKKDNKISQAYLLVTAMLFIMTAVIILLLLYNRSKSKKNMAELTTLYNKNNKQTEQLENTLGELENRNKEKDRILGIVAHDLRNPIAAISSLISILEEEHEYTQDQQEIFGLMQNACKNSIELISEILEFAVTDSNGGNSPTEQVDVNLIAANCVKMMRFKAAEKKQKLQLFLSGTPEIIKASPAKMWRVISNIITNAVKFSPPSTIIEITTGHFNGNVQVSVKDMGIGIPDDIKNKIFDTHTEAKRAGTMGEKPFGLGLSICKQIVESYQGRIWFEPAAERGTIFYIDMPKQN